MNIPVWRCSLVREGTVKAPGCIRGPKEAAAAARAVIPEDSDRETLVVLLLDSQNTVRGANVVTVGILNASLIHPREVFKPAILGSAASVIVAHNHPSGDPKPSPEDIRVTQQLVDAGKILGIPVRDHVILGDGTGEYVSLQERGLLSQ